MGGGLPSSRHKSADNDYPVGEAKSVTERPRATVDSGPLAAHVGHLPSSFGRFACSVTPIPVEHQSCQIRYSNAGRVCHHPRGSRIASAIARSHSSQVKEIMSLDPRRYGREWVVGPDSVWATRGEPRTITRNKATIREPTRHRRGEACGSYPKVACPALQSVIRAKLFMWRGLCRRHPEG